MHKIKMSTSSSDFDKIIFVQQWLPTTFYNSRDRADIRHGTPEKMVEEKIRWSVNGLWPKEREYWEEYTNAHNINNYKDSKFDKVSLQPIEAKLKNVYFDVKNTDIYPFLERVYEKHGSCMICLPSTNNELKYFTKQLELHAKYDMTKILAMIDIIPGNSYTYGEIHEALANYLGKKCTIICLKCMKTGHWFLSKIYLYFNIVFKLIDTDLPWQLSSSTRIYYINKADDIRNKKYLKYLSNGNPVDDEKNSSRDGSECQLI